MASSNSLTAAVRSAMSCVSWAIVAVKSSISALSWLTSWVLAARVNLFATNSASHQPLCSVSDVPSSISFEIKSLMSFFTFLNGSLAARNAASESKRLPVRWARPARNAAARSRKGLCASLESCIAIAGFAERHCLSWSSVGKCVSPAPATVLLEMTSMALSNAPISSARSLWRLLKSAAFCSQSAVMSSKYVWSSSRSFVVCAKSPSSAALVAAVCERNSFFLETSCSAFSMLSISCCMIKP
mmetsp:Transcript_50625/g.141774  ORF Transcript_50625/g.141774 Transcript_50625/m.141774 type:complete len:243 (+) Transcript_50625:889-1617(+)